HVVGCLWPRDCRCLCRCAGSSPPADLSAPPSAVFSCPQCRFPTARVCNSRVETRLEPGAMCSNGIGTDSALSHSAHRKGVETMYHTIEFRVAGVATFQVPSGAAREEARAQAGGR